MLNSNKLKISLSTFIIIFSAILDQWSKTYVIKQVKILENPITLIDNFLHIVYLENTGITFGLLNNLPSYLRLPILIMVPLIVMGFLLYLLYKVKPNAKITYIAYSLILGGAIGNILDRIFYSYVVDFIRINLYFMWWPAFNIADAVIIIGMCLLGIEVLRGKQIFERNK